MEAPRLACPSCGSADDLATTETILGVAPADFYFGGDTEWAGETEVDWDSSTTVGIECGCGWSMEGDDARAALVPEHSEPEYRPVSSAARQAWIDGEDDPDELRAIDAENVEPQFIHTSCALCGHDIEGQIGSDDWRDRGNGTTCLARPGRTSSGSLFYDLPPDGQRHAPVPEAWL